jgi:chemotaxis protein MotA
MVFIIGSIVVFASVFIGFSMAGGHFAALIQPSEFVTIGGSAFGALIIMSPAKVLKDLLKATIGLLKGSVFNKAMYTDLLTVLYGLASIVRRDGLLALESHVNDPHSSAVFQESAKLAHNHHAMHFLTQAFGMIVDGMDAASLEKALHSEIDVIDREHHNAIAALSKTADGLPGFGIVAAVLGIVVTMGHIDGPVEEIGHHVGAALVGTFLGILASYGFLAPMAGRMELSGHEEKQFFHAITAGAVAVQQGTSPKEVVSRICRGIPSDCRPSADQLKEITTAK